MHSLCSILLPLVFPFHPGGPSGPVFEKTLSCIIVKQSGSKGSRVLVYTAKNPH